MTRFYAVSGSFANAKSVEVFRTKSERDRWVADEPMSGTGSHYSQNREAVTRREAEKQLARGENKNARRKEMAIVFDHRNGVYERRNEYNVDDLNVEEAVEVLIGSRGDWANGEEFRVTSDGLESYGDNAVLIERENESGEYEPYMIIADSEYQDPEN